ncbi:restriction endonuclease [Dyadobacter sp. CY261]|uniref:restriction endonuclease n=1 Tax=Dyadobacter sp. CY261 TaxID=2907203 RepID=UPI001F434B22|nr:restriction endonuclease [Dyadobacter sp. CY261]MCF0072461.1 restriction endonuclease [Dyadobacter sp. CY261]
MSLQQGADFERQVQSILKLQGHAVSGERLLGSKKIDLYFEQINFNKKNRIAVECKNYNNRLTKNELIQIFSDYLALIESNLIDQVLLVTSNGLTASSEEYVRLSNRISHATLNDLISTTIDFSQYINNTIFAYEKSPDGLMEYYIQLNSLDSLSIFNNSSDWYVGKGLFPIVQQWIKSEDPMPIAVLGSYGQGKTSFARYLTYTLSIIHTQDNSQRIPIYIKLNAISKEQSVEGLLGRELASSFSIKNYNYAAFSELNYLGKFVIILDGFDEMKHSLSWEEFKFNFGELNKLIGGRSKVIILGRPNAFLNDDEHNFILKGLWNSAFGTLRDSSWPSFHELRLAPLNPDQIKEFLTMYLTFEIKKSKDQSQKKKLQHAINYKISYVLEKKLKDISSRPVQLKMLADLLPYLSTDEDNWTTAILYSEFIKMILSREYTKESSLHISSENRRAFSRKIAVYLWENSNEYSIKNEEIPIGIFREFVHGESRELEKIKRDYVSGCFLSRKLGNSLYFPHKSFQEFFVAEEFVTKINQATHVDLAWIQKNMTKEVSDFFVELIGGNEISRLDRSLSTFRGSLNSQFLKVYLRRNAMTHITEKLKMNSGDPWPYLIYTYCKISKVWPEEDIKLGELICNNFSLKVILQDNLDPRFLVLSIFLLCHNDNYRYRTKYIAELSRSFINECQRFSKTNSAKNSMHTRLTLDTLTNIFSKIIVKKKGGSVSLSDLGPLFFEYLSNWCFVSDWCIGQTTRLPNADFSFFTENDTSFAEGISLAKDIANKFSDSFH